MRFGAQTQISPPACSFSKDLIRTPVELQFNLNFQSREINKIQISNTVKLRGNHEYELHV